MIKKFMIFTLGITLLVHANHIPAVIIPNRMEIMEEGSDEPPP